LAPNISSSGVIKIIYFHVLQIFLLKLCSFYDTIMRRIIVNKEIFMNRKKLMSTTSGRRYWHALEDASYVRFGINILSLSVGGATGFCIASNMGLDIVPTIVCSFAGLAGLALSPDF